jgi:hypothetical protein
MNLFFSFSVWVRPSGSETRTLVTKASPKNSDADPHNFDAHPDSDHDPACHFFADPNPTLHFDADPETDPRFQIKAQTLEKLLK